MFTSVRTTHEASSSNPKRFLTGAGVIAPFLVGVLPKESQSFNLLMDSPEFNNFFADSVVVGIPLDTAGLPTGGIELWHVDSDPTGSFLTTQHEAGHTNMLWIIMAYNLSQNVLVGWDEFEWDDFDGENSGGFLEDQLFGRN